jgi:hypothetical protein
MTGHANLAKTKNRMPKPISIQKINPTDGVTSGGITFFLSEQKYKKSYMRCEV